MLSETIFCDRFSTLGGFSSLRPQSRRPYKQPISLHLKNPGLLFDEEKKKNTTKKPKHWTAGLLLHESCYSLLGIICNDSGGNLVLMVILACCFVIDTHLDAITLDKW